MKFWCVVNIYGHLLSFFEKEFESIYGKAGITKLEIQRKINQLELIIPAARPKAIAADQENDNLVTSLKSSLSTVVKGSKQIRITVCYQASLWDTS